MPSEQQLQDTLEELSQYVEDIDDTVLGDLDESDDIGIGGADAKGIWCTHGSNRYVIFGESSDKYLQIAYPRLIIANIARKLGDEAVDELLSDYTAEEIEKKLDQQDSVEQIESEDTSEESEHLRGREILAAQEWLGSLDPELVQEIRYHLKERLTSPQVGYQILPDGADAIHGFIVLMKIYPYDRSISLQEFNDRVQSVISIGVAGDSFLGTTFNLREEEIDTPAPPIDELR